jgi:hypothetical protein
MTDDESAFTVDPDLFESDASLGRSVTYTEEAGARRSYPEGNALSFCEACGMPVLLGELENGTRVVVEVETCTYVLYWRQKALKQGTSNPPTLTASRGYPAHTCRAQKGTDD